jgi:broad specificity phosphatase PhoE
MKIGLVRHYKVDLKNPKPYYYPEEFRDAMKEYDEADVIKGSTNLDGIDWDICFSSSLKRAVITAKDIYKGEIIITDLIREVSLLPFTMKKIKLPWTIWHICARIAWSKNSKTQDETRQETTERMNLIYKKILDAKKENVLLVTHGFFMKCFIKFLREKSFTGKVEMFPKNGCLYIFENKKG